MSDWAKELTTKFEQAEANRSAEEAVVKIVANALAERVRNVGRELGHGSEHRLALEEHGNSWSLVSGSHQSSLASLQFNWKSGGRSSASLKLTHREPWVLFDVSTDQLGKPGDINWELARTFEERLRHALQLCLTSYWLEGERAPVFALENQNGDIPVR